MAQARAWHEGQERKGTATPYLGHLLGVAALVIEAGGDEDQAIAALLHDTLEDQPERVSADDLERRFGPRVLAIVQGCSDGDAGTARTAATWASRKAAYVAHLRSATDDVRLVSLCDKLHNARAIVLDLRTIGREVWTRFSAGRELQLDYHEQLAAAFTSAPPPNCAPLVAELSRVVAEMRAL